MGKNVYLHGFWLLIAIGAFVTGRTVRVSSEDGETKTAEYGSRGGRDGGAGAKGGTESRRESGPGEGGELIGALGGRVLSPEAMRMAITSIIAESDPVVRQRRFGELLASLTPENARVAVETLRNAPRAGWSMWQEISLLTYAWGRIDGPAAAAYASEIEGRSGEWTMASVLAGWANDDPSGAKDWVAAVEDQDERSKFMRGLVQGLAQRDVEAATSFVFSLDSETPRRGDYIKSITRQQLTAGIDLAATWSGSLPDGELKGEALETVAREFVRKDPEAAAAWLSKFGEDEYGREAFRELSEEWAEEDPIAAVDWVQKLPEGENRSAALGETVSEWARKSPEEAGEFVAEMPAGQERDVAIGAYARRMVSQEPESAMEWAQSIEQEDLRNKTITQAARDWMRRDVVAASAWLDESGLPEQVATEILRPEEVRRDDRWRR